LGCALRHVHYSVQKDHLHCLIEAEDKRALSNGMKSLGARFARTVRP
jgi:REP element-mobilizing transposase RayT